MDEIRVTSWAELNDLLFENAWQSDIQRFRSPYAFRGISYANKTDLITSLARMSSPHPNLEGNLLRSFIKYAHGNSALSNSIWHWLALAQHHGLPTRLLDWTYSPTIALHFATTDFENFDTDAAIWRIDYKACMEFLPTQFRKVLNEEVALVFTVEMLNSVVTNLKELQAMEAQAQGAFVVFIEPPSLDERIVNQFALFSFMSNASARMDDWLADKPHLYRRIVIPVDLKWEVRDRLDQMNVTERVLFPGLDGLCRWLKRYYYPR